MMENSVAPAVEVERLRKTYGDKVAVEDVSFRVEPGEVFGILGPNGAGKTTTVESVCGLRVGDAGRVRVHGIDPWTDRDATTRMVGVQLQESRLQPKITVREALEMWAAFYDDPLPWSEPAERLGLVDHLDQRFGRLSGGQQQRLSIALALVGRPRVAILDELSTGLDPRARREVWSLVRDLRDHGTTVLLVTHGMEEAEELCDRVAIIDRGSVRAIGTPSELIGGAAAATVTSFEPSEPVDLVALRRARRRCRRPRRRRPGDRDRAPRARRSPCSPASRARASYPIASGSSTARSTRPTSTSTLDTHRAHRSRGGDRMSTASPTSRRHPDGVAALLPRARLAVLDRALPHDPGRDPRARCRA